MRSRVGYLCMCWILELLVLLLLWMFLGGLWYLRCLVMFCIGVLLLGLVFQFKPFLACGNFSNSLLLLVSCFGTILRLYLFLSKSHRFAFYLTFLFTGECIQLGELVLQNTNINDWAFEKCNTSSGCLVNLVSNFHMTR